ncbi:MAG TPA: putative baseplate assembly protein [Candidatus Lustribacter sp.]|nr:putative baseplate assembly protein [Candidatus Lustribacter sp.]
MPIPLPNLDDRRFQDLVDDAKRMVQQSCPEWTDHNVSDPGVTLIETFAYLVDTLLYRLNRIPDKLYLAFLDLIGVSPHPPTAASVEATFWLSAPQDHDVTVHRGTHVSTVRTEQDEAVVFETTRDLVIPVRSMTAVATQARDGDVVARAIEVREGSGFAAFTTSPRPGDAVLVALDEAAPLCAVALRWDCEVKGVGVNPEHAPLRWEAWTGTGWVACDTERDGTGGLNRPGYIIVHLPAGHVASVIGGVRGGWVRTVVTEPEPDYPAYVSSPLVRSVEAQTVGGTVRAVHAEEVFDEVVGLSEGIPGQSFPLARTPVVDDGRPMVLEVASGPGWLEWQEVSSFADQSAADLVFRVDRAAGRVELGPAVREPDGTVTRFGAVPPKGAPLRVPAYRTGGGPRGNVAARAISVLRTSVPLIERVENRRTASGGTAGETIEQVRVRGPLDLRTRDRAVTAADIEVLARRAAPSIARVRAIAEGDYGARLLVVPVAPVEADGRVRFEDLVPPEATLAAVTEFLDTRRVIGTRLVIEPPFYQGVTVVARVLARRRTDTDSLREAALAALYQHFSPLTGGPDGEGWPFGRPVHVGEVYAVLQRLPGTELVEEVRLFAADPTTAVRGDPTDRIALDANALVFSFGHQVKVIKAG